MNSRDNLTVKKNSNPTVTIDGTRYNTITVEKYGCALNKNHRTFYFVISERNRTGAPIALRAYLKKMDNDNWDTLSHFPQFFMEKQTAIIARIPEVDHCSAAAKSIRRVSYINIKLNNQLTNAKLKQQCHYIICLFQAMENSGHFHRREGTANITSRKNERLGFVMGEFEKFFPFARPTTTSSTQTTLTSLATSAIQNQQDNILGISDEHNIKVTVNGIVHNVITTESYGAAIKPDSRIFCFFMEKGNAYSGTRILHAYIRSVDGEQWDRIASFNHFFNQYQTQLTLDIPRLNGCIVRDTSNKQTAHICLKIVLDQTINVAELKEQGKYIITLFQAMVNSDYFPLHKYKDHRTNYEDRYDPIITEFNKLLACYKSNEEKIASTMSSSSQTMLSESASNSSQEGDDSYNLTFAEYERRDQQRKLEHIPSATTEINCAYSESLLIDSHHFEKKSEQSSINGFDVFSTTTLINPATAETVRKKRRLSESSGTFFEACNISPPKAAWEDKDEDAYATQFTI